MQSRLPLTLVVLLLLALFSLAHALSVGSLPVSLPEIWAAITQQGGGQAEIILELRLPRALAAFAVGGLLALAGALMQILLRNPLADPYVLGISGGAGVGAMLAILLALSGLGIDLLAFAGALMALLLVFGLAHSEGSWTQTRLLLTGVIVAAGCSAVIALLLSVAPETKLRGMLFWLMGDLAQASQPGPALIVLAIVMVLVWPLGRDLNLLARGETTAQTLGVAVPRLRQLIYFLAAVATATAVTQAGAVGFIGLVVPHLLRQLIGNDQRWLLPACALGGGSLLVVADTLARSMLAPQQLPVGVLTALIGVPLFLFLLSRAEKPR